MEQWLRGAKRAGCGMESGVVVIELFLPLCQYLVQLIQITGGQLFVSSDGQLD